MLKRRIQHSKTNLDQLNRIVKKQLLLHKPIQQNLHAPIRHLNIAIIIKFDLRQQIIQLNPRINL
jgi:hypothetical protein